MTLKEQLDAIIATPDHRLRRMAEARDSGAPFLMTASEDGPRSEPGLAVLQHFNAQAEIVEAPGDHSPGKLKMKCAPYGEYGLLAYFGEVMLGPDYFAESLERLNAGEGKAYIYGDAHIGAPTTLLASTTAGNVEFWEEDDGLYAEVVLPDTQAGRDVATLVEAGILEECSIGWVFDEIQPAEDAEEDEEKYYSAKGTLREVSMVHRGAYPSQYVEMADEAEDNETAEETNVVSTIKVDTSDMAAASKALIHLAGLNAELRATIEELKAESDEESEEDADEEEAETAARNIISEHGHLTLLAGHKPKEGHDDRHRYLAERLSSSG